MTIDILTLFPEMFFSLNYSLLGKAQEKQLVSIQCHNIRDFATDKHQRCDDYPFGGGVGMVMLPEPIHRCINFVDPDHKCLRIFLSPRGRTLNQQLVEELSSHPKLLLLCGHYEGVDQRVIDLDIDLELSIGDYVLSGGEIPAMVLVDCVMRYIPSVLGNSQATLDESFSDGLLEYPQYTRPQEFCGLAVPEVLISGHHKKIKEWRKEQSLLITKKNRPDLLLKGED